MRDDGEPRRIATRATRLLVIDKGCPAATVDWSLLIASATLLLFASPLSTDFEQRDIERRRDLERLRRDLERLRRELAAGSCLGLTRLAALLFALGGG